MPLLTDHEVDEEIGADWQSILSKHEGDDEPETPADAPEPETAAPEPETNADDPPRREDGKFAKRPKADKAEKGEKQPTDAPEQPAAAAKTETQADTAGRDLNRAPSSWKPTARAAWDKVPAEIRAEIHRRESDFMAGQSQLLPDAKFGKDLREVIEPYRMLIQSEGGTPEAAVKDLLNTAAILRTGTAQQKLQTVAAVAQRYGIDLRVFGQPRPGAPNQQQPQPQQFRDPRVDTLLTQMQTQEQQRQAAEQRSTEDAVNRWMNEADAQGNPKRPYVNDVIGDMSALIPILKQQNPAMSHTEALALAYERATWANPEIRTLLQREAQAKLDAERRSENQQRVRDARRAASVNAPRRASIPSVGKPGSMDDTIAATARELGLISS